MRDDVILLLALAAALAFGGLLVSIGLDAGFLSPERGGLTACERSHPDWDPNVCAGIADGRYTTQEVLENPSWDWETIGAERIRTGMTKAMVEAAWGSPTYVNETGFNPYDEEWALGGRLLRFTGEVLADIIDAQIWSVYGVLSSADQNEVSFEDRTSGERVFLVGNISDIGSEYDGSPRLEFEHPDFWDEIHCIFPLALRGDVAVLRKRQRVVVLGIGNGVGILGPEFTSCRIFTTP